MKINKPSFSAVTFGYLLAALLVVTVVLIGTGYYWGSKLLAEQALRADHAKIDASLKNEDVAKLKRLEAELVAKKDIVARAEQIIAESRQYQYQDQIVHDINSFAKSAGVEVLGYNFGTPEQSKKGAKGASLSLSGVNAISANVSLASPQSYKNLLRFMKAIEQNLTKMQVTGVNITPDPEDPNLVSNPVVGVVIYVRAQ
jgi:hypothetical protein